MEETSIGGDQQTDNEGTAQINEEQEDIVSKKIVAIEVYKMHKRGKSLAIGIIIASFIIAIFSAYSMYGGAAAAGVVSIGAAWIVRDDILQMRYLDNKYGVKENLK